MQRYLLPSTGRGQTQRLEWRKKVAFDQLVSVWPGVLNLSQNKIKNSFSFIFLLLSNSNNFHFPHLRRASKSLQKDWRNFTRLKSLTQIYAICVSFPSFPFFYFLANVWSLNEMIPSLSSSNVKCKTESFLQRVFCKKNKSMSPFNHLHLQIHKLGWKWLHYP